MASPRAVTPSPFPGLTNTLAASASMESAPYFSALSTNGVQVFPVAHLAHAAPLRSQAALIAEHATAHALLAPNVVAYAVHDRVCVRAVGDPDRRVEMHPLRARVQSLALAHRSYDEAGRPCDGAVTHVLVVAATYEGVYAAHVPLVQSSSSPSSAAAAAATASLMMTPDVPQQMGLLGGSHVQPAVLVTASRDAVAAATMDGRVAVWHGSGGDPDAMVAQPESCAVGDRITDVALLGDGGLVVAWWSGAVFRYGAVAARKTEEEEWKRASDLGLNELSVGSVPGTLVAVRTDQCVIAAVRGDGLVSMFNAATGARLQRRLRDRQGGVVRVKGLVQHEAGLWVWVDGAEHFVKVDWADVVEIDQAAQADDREKDPKKNGRERCRRRMDALMAG